MQLQDKTCCEFTYAYHNSESVVYFYHPTVSEYKCLWRMVSGTFVSSPVCVQEMIEAVRESLVHIVHTKEGAQVTMHCLWHGTAKVSCYTVSPSILRVESMNSSYPFVLWMCCPGLPIVLVVFVQNNTWKCFLVSPTIPAGRTKSAIHIDFNLHCHLSEFCWWHDCAFCPPSPPIISNDFILVDFVSQNRDFSLLGTLSHLTLYNEGGGA